MNKQYSLLRVIKNKIGYSSILIWFVSIICFIITLLFIKDLYIKIYFFTISVAIFFIIPIYSIINVLKINYYFKNGIEAKAIVKDNLYVRIGPRELPFTELGSDLGQNGAIYAYKNKWGRHEYKRNGAIYEYKIDGEIYQSSSKFGMNGETMFLKEGSIIKILENQKNKNKAIIKDIYKLV
jgi:hypothetical protein